MGNYSHIGRGSNIIFYFIIMSEQNTFEQIKLIIADKLGVKADDIKPESKFVDDLGADSLDTVEVIMEFEIKFNIAFRDDEAEKIETVQEAVDLINKKLNV